MKRLLPFLFLLTSTLAFGQVSKLNPIKNPSLDELRKNFVQPHRDYSTGPLWTWNDLLTEEQIRSTLQDLAKQNVKQVWVHPRPGLMTPYLSDDWFRMWKISLDEAEKLDMNVWIYDENSYPSGFAGGFVPKALPDSRGMGLRFEEVDKLDNIDENTWYVFDPAGKNITDTAKRDGKLPPLENNQKYLLAKVQYTPQGGWFGGTWYVDLLKKGVTEKFIEVTHEAYKREVGEHFGKRIPGIFTDEPHPAGPYVGTWVSWNDEIPKLFENKFGYSLIDNLPSLHKPVGDWKKVRHNYHALILELFVERWAKPNFEWCEANNLQWTGHYWEHGWPGTGHCPDNMAMYIWHQRPAIDLLMNTYNDKSPNAQFGNVRSVKELASIANQMGHSRTLSENYGAGGWDLRFEDMKRLGDWSYALGVNTNNEHLSYVTIRGARKRDHPQSFSYHSPWFEGYHTMADYFTRLSYILSQGRQINRIVVIEPTTTAWMYQGDAKLGEIGQSFTDFVNSLEHAQVEYDLASEDTIARFGNVDGKTFSINHGKYDVVILPPNMENLNSRTAELLVQYVQLGGRLLVASEFPIRVDGAEPGEVESQWLQLIKVPPKGVNMMTESGGFNPQWIDQLTDLPNVRQCKANEVLSVMFDDWKLGDSVLSLCVERDSEGKIFHHRRTLPDCTILFLCNASQSEVASGSMRFGNDYMLEEWDLMTGSMKQIILPFMLQKIEHNPNEFHSYSTIPHYRFEISPSGSKLLVLWKTSETLANRPEDVTPETKTTPGSDTTAKRLEPNVLTLDYVDVKVGNEERKDVYAYQADQWIWQKNRFGKNPFDNEVQFKDELITKTFPAESGFEAVYKFVIEESGDTVASSLAIVIERADLYTIYHNGIEVKPTPDAWWLDKSFGKIDLSKTAKVGENTVRIVSSPLTVWTALEPAYLLGDFSLRNDEKGFVVCPPTPLTMNADELPLDVRHSDELERVSWLSAGIGFRPNGPYLVDRSPTLTFEFDREYPIAAIRIWNYCERGLQKRGVKEVEISYAGKLELPMGDGSAKDILTAIISQPVPIKSVEFKILSNHAGTTYPMAQNARPDDNGFVGLAEVQFLIRDGDELVPVKNVKVTASSELVVDSHDRRARYLLDGSGLEPYQPQQGWNAQGMPFYAGKVEYSRSFDIEKVEGKYSVKLPDSAPGATGPTGWYGATAKVIVNGNDAGYVVSAPWQVDITPFVKQGKNEVSVQVYGTLKNLLGPHHAGRLRGSAWPNAFQRAPEKQPAGSAYDVIGYGLFEPFELLYNVLP